MLAEGKIDSLDTHLEQFKLNNRTAQHDLQNLLKEYGQLLDDYKDLKKAFDTKGTKSSGKSAFLPRLPAAKPRDPYVLVLIDGNGYIFNDELIRDKEEGGMRAARMLNDAVEKYLQQNVPEAQSSRIVVRVYADLTNLSKQLAKSKVTGLEKRSIAPFSAAFTRAISLFDFVDALDEEGTKFKIREQFKIASEDDACSHILYAACHDTAYLSQLVPLSGLREKVTLVQGAGWNSEFHQFNLNVTQFPTVFRWLDLPDATPSTKAPLSNGFAPPKPKITQKNIAPIVPTGPRHHEMWRGDSLSARGSVMDGDRPPSTTNGFESGSGSGVSFGSKAAPSSQKTAQLPCKFFQKGFCRFGSKCSFQHVGAHNNTDAQPSGTSPNRARVSALLPTSTAPGYISLNKHSQRLDNYIRPPTQEEWSIYNARFHKQKPCNSFHLQRVCTTYGCPYDHNELEPESRHVLEYVVKCSPCPQKSECRASDCFYGHICQKDGCQGQMKGCRMKTDLHSVDPKLASMVPADDEVDFVHDQNEGLQMHGRDEGVQMPSDNGYNW